MGRQTDRERTQQIAGYVEQLIHDYGRHSPRPKLPRQQIERHILGDHVMGNKHILPRLATVASGMVAGVPTPGDGSVLLGQDIGIVQRVLGLRLQHVDHRVRLADEVWLVFWVIGALFVVDLELALRRPEPLQRLAFQNDRQPALRVRLKFLDRIETARKPAEQILRHVALIGRRLAEV